MILMTMMVMGMMTMTLLMIIASAAPNGFKATVVDRGPALLESGRGEKGQHRRKVKPRMYTHIIVFQH